MIAMNKQGTVTEGIVNINYIQSNTTQPLNAERLLKWPRSGPFK